MPKTQEWQDEDLARRTPFVKRDAGGPLTISSVVGKTYLERGEPVVVLLRWTGKGPRNVLIQRGDGSKVVRPFRGLRRLPS